MSAIVDALLAELDDQALDQLAEALAPRLAARLGASEPAPELLNSVEAAKYLACSRDRLYDLVQLGRLMPVRDGRRLLFKRSELASYLETGARGRP